MVVVVVVQMEQPVVLVEDLNKVHLQLQVIHLQSVLHKEIQVGLLLVVIEVQVVVVQLLQVVYRMEDVEHQIQ
tara:strand:+ start:278 stop:496 length:219 start_codon:yes stop_codon:yes gene_type:complete